jgi:hypothetical protein
MAESIFGANSPGVYKGAFSTALGSALTFNSAVDSLMLIQNIQVSHQQPVQPLFEVGSNNRYYVVGKASGTFSATQILGFGDAALKQVTSLANPCEGDRTLKLVLKSPFCEVGANAVGAGRNGPSLTLNLTGVLLSSVGFSIAAQDNLINSQIQGIMTDLDYDYK